MTLVAVRPKVFVFSDGREIPEIEGIEETMVVIMMAFLTRERLKSYKKKKKQCKVNGGFGDGK